MTKHQRRAARLKTAGLCRQCGDAPFTPGRDTCAICREDERARSQARRERLRAEGPACARCPKFAEARGLCYRHYYEKYRSVRREQRKAA